MKQLGYTYNRIHSISPYKSKDLTKGLIEYKLEQEKPAEEALPRSNYIDFEIGQVKESE